MKKVGLKWSPAVPVRKPNNIMSSRARENGQMGFRPSYENEPRENMNFIMSNEYMRIWFKERKIYEINTYSKDEVETGASNIKRKYVQHTYKNKKQSGRTLPPIKLKRFANVTSKTDHKRSNAKSEAEAA